MPSLLRVTLLLAFVLAVVAPAGATTNAAIPNPKDFFGFEPGTARHLVDYGQLVAYLKRLDEGSQRIELRDVGASPMGRRMYVLFISAEDNIARLDELRELNRKLALENGLENAEREQLVTDGRVFVMATLSMHSSEVGPTQALPILAHDLATTDDEEVLAQLSQVVLMIVPCHNPDGMEMVVDYYREQLGTKYEGATLPGIYHRYVGHDNNRDFVTLTQKDTQVISRLYSTEWYPQVLVEKHQMGSAGPRYFVPANHDPIAENIDELLWTWTELYGANLSLDMTVEGLEGVASHWLFDNYWPGSTETSLWKNVVSFLTEAASCKVATPVFVEANELSVRGKGLSEYKKSVNMPAPWPGGWWGLDDLVRYELTSMYSILKTSAGSRHQILRLRNELCRREVQRGLTEAPAYFVLPQDQADGGELVDLVALLLEHGVRVSRLGAEMTVGGHVLEPGDVIIPLSQPYRAFVKEVMEAQRYPVRHYTPGGEMMRPYDITSWSLPLHRGLRCLEIDVRSPQLEAALTKVDDASHLVEPKPGLDGAFWGLAYPATDNASFKAAFSALAEGIEVRRLTSSSGPVDSPLPAGSFVLVAPNRSRDLLARITEETSTPAIVLSAPPDAATRPLAMPRIALVETWFHDMDAGWTRYVFDRFHVPFTVLRPGEVNSTDLAAAFDVLVFPDVAKEVLTKGQVKRGDRYVARDYPPKYREPISDEGIRRLVDFIDKGGVILSWGGSTRLFTEAIEVKPKDDGAESIQLPVRDISDELHEQGLDAPGSLLRARLLEGHPLTLGMPPEAAVFVENGPVFVTSIPTLDMDRRVIMTYPEDKILLSGFLEGEEQLAEQSAMVWLKKGRGQLVLYGFSPQFRASTSGTYKLLLNALLLPRLQE